MCLPKHDLLARNHYLEFRIKVDKTKEKQQLGQYDYINTIPREMLSLQPHKVSLLIIYIVY